MPEDSGEKPPAQQPATPEKKPAPPVQAPAAAPRPAVPAAAPQAPRPAPQQPRPAASPPPAAPSKPPVKDPGRRAFVRAALLVGAVLSMVPFVPWGTFLSSTVKTGSSTQYLYQKVTVDDLPALYGAAAGQAANINDLTTFPPNKSWVFTYPTSGDPVTDAQNPDTFQKFALIRMPVELGGDSKKATDFVAFSKVCVHLWCSPNYNPENTTNPADETYQCPCHGSVYRLPDGLAIAGPAALQAFPQNAIPMMTLQADASGDLWVFAPNYDPATGSPVADPIEADGVIGFGRDYQSYENFLKPAALKPVNVKDETVVLSG